MVPWVIVYAVNILGMFAGSILMFYAMPGAWKTLGLLPLFGGIITLMGHFGVLFFMIEQRADLDIYLSAQAREAEGGGVAAVSSWYSRKSKYAKLRQEGSFDKEETAESSPMWLRWISENKDGDVAKIEFTKPIKLWQLCSTLQQGSPKYESMYFCERIRNFTVQ